MTEQTEAITEDAFWQAVIQALLMLVDAIERWRGIVPRTSLLRRAGKRAILSVQNTELKMP